MLLKHGRILKPGALLNLQLPGMKRRVSMPGPIPGLGASSASLTESEKTHPMRFIRPVIMRDSVRATRGTSAKYRCPRDSPLRLEARNAA